ncbi:UNVERIFIED_CONTAM: hypothetical protein Slati_1359200, partial [Sesamum latifolium]
VGGCHCGSALGWCVWGWRVGFYDWWFDGFECGAVREISCVDGGREGGVGYFFDGMSS